MKINNRSARGYCRSVRSWLPCSGKLKRRIMAQISGSVQDYLEQHPDAELADLQAQFGMPQDIAAAYIANTGTAEILRNLRVRRRVVAIVVATALIVLLTWAVAVTCASIDARNTIHGFIEVTIE